ncbi:MAG: hypothetical protein ACRERC_25630, partial [Candidatus Binatia bacterium]
VNDCCACLDTPAATTQQTADPIAAVFCAQAVGTPQFDAITARCEALPGGYLVCVPKSAGLGQSCQEILLVNESIACPSDAGVPALGHPALASLAALLAGGAMIGLRRRARRPA